MVSNYYLNEKLESSKQNPESPGLIVIKYFILSFFRY